MVCVLRVVDLVPKELIERVKLLTTLSPSSGRNDLAKLMVFFRNYHEFHVCCILYGPYSMGRDPSTENTIFKTNPNRKSFFLWEVYLSILDLMHIDNVFGETDRD